MASLRRSKGPFLGPDGQTAKFLYQIIKQLDLKNIDWNEVASGLEITNGHAARMRFSRFKAQVEGTTKEPRAPRVRKEGNKHGKLKNGKTKKGKLDGLEDERNGNFASGVMGGNNCDEDVKMEDEVDVKAELTPSIRKEKDIQVKKEPMIKQEPNLTSNEINSLSNTFRTGSELESAFNFKANDSLWTPESTLPAPTPIKTEPTGYYSEPIWSFSSAQPLPPAHQHQHQHRQQVAFANTPLPSPFNYPYSTVSMSDLQLPPNSTPNPVYAYEASDPSLCVPRYMPDNMSTNANAITNAHSFIKTEGQESGGHGAGQQGEVRVKDEPLQSGIFVK